MTKNILIVVLLIVQGTSWAQNLINNGDFDTDISGWSNTFVTSSWDGSNGSPMSGNGSMRVEGTSNNNASFYMESNEFDVTEGHIYWFSAGFNPPTPSPVPRGWSRMIWTDDMGVPIVDSQDTSSTFGVPNDTWTYFEGDFIAPAGAVKGALRVYLQSGAPGETETPFGLWDDVSVLEETVFMSGFE